MVGASKNDLMSPIIFRLCEALSHKNYIEVVRLHAKSEGQRLLGDDTSINKTAQRLTNIRNHWHSVKRICCIS